MKTTQLIFAFITLFLFTSITTKEKEESLVKVTSADILEKCIKHYDPNDNWDDYKGKVFLKIIFLNRNYSANLEINNATDFYQSTNLNDEVKIIMGVEDNKCFRMIGTNSQLTDEQIKQNNLECENIKMAKEHHICHFGFIMNMEKAGLKIEKKVATENFNGWDCYVISFSGTEPDVIHKYYVGSGKLYIDKVNYRLRGKIGKHPDYPERKIIYNGELKVNDIILPEVVINYRDNTYYFVDIFLEIQE